MGFFFLRFWVLLALVRPLAAPSVTTTQGAYGGSRFGNELGSLFFFLRSVASLGFTSTVSFLVFYMRFWITLRYFYFYSISILLKVPARRHARMCGIIGTCWVAEVFPVRCLSALALPLWAVRVIYCWLRGRSYAGISFVVARDLAASHGTVAKSTAWYHATVA